MTEMTFNDFIADPRSQPNAPLQILGSVLELCADQGFTLPYYVEMPDLLEMGKRVRIALPDTGGDGDAPMLVRVVAMCMIVNDLRGADVDDMSLAMRLMDKFSAHADLVEMPVLSFETE